MGPTPSLEHRRRPLPSILVRSAAALSAVVSSILIHLPSSASSTSSSSSSFLLLAPRRVSLAPIFLLPPHRRHHTSAIVSALRPPPLRYERRYHIPKNLRRRHHNPPFTTTRRTMTNHDDDSSRILESPSAERNKGPIYDVVLGPLVFPRLINDALSRVLPRGSGNDDDRGGDGDGWDESGGDGGGIVIRVLELAAGCGVHTVHFASSFLSSTTNDDVGLEWHPSDPDVEARISIDARSRLASLPDRASILPSNSWTLGKAGGTALGDGGQRDKDGDGGASRAADSGDDSSGRDYDDRANYFDLVLCINMIHIAPWEATLGLMECAGSILRGGGLLVTYGPYKVGGDAVESNLNFDTSLRAKNPEWGLRNIEDVINAAEERGMELYRTVEMPANNLCVLFRKK